MVIKRVTDDIAPGVEMHICPNCEQETEGDSCRWCGYPIITDDVPEDDHSGEDGSELDSALRRAAEKRLAAEKTLQEAEARARREDEGGVMPVTDRVMTPGEVDVVEQEGVKRSPAQEINDRVEKEAEEKARWIAEEKAREEAREREKEEARERTKREAKEKAKQEAEAAKRAKRQEMKAAKEAEREARERAKRWEAEVKKNRKQAEREEKERKKEEARKKDRERARSATGKETEAGVKAPPVAGGKKKDIYTGGGGNGVFKGSVKLVLPPPLPTAAMRNFEAALYEIDGMSMGLMSGAESGGLHMDVFCETPVNLMDRLNSIPSVAEAVKENKRSIRVALRTD